MFFIYDCILLRQSAIGNRVQAKKECFKDLEKEIAELDRKDILRAHEDFKNNVPSKHPIIRKLLTKMRMISSFTPESWGQKLHLRHLLFAKIVRLALPAIWFTINPSDLHNPLVLRLAGVDLSVGIENVPNIDRIRAMKDPVVIAEFFDMVVSNFFASLVRSQGASLRCQSSKMGVLGRAIDHFGVVESTQRQMLHLHGFVWLNGNEGLDKMSVRIQTDTAFKDRVLNYLGSIVSESLDEVSGLRWEAFDDGSIFEIDEEGDLTSFLEEMYKDANYVAAHFQVHQHTQTCTKHILKNKAKGTEFNTPGLEGADDREEAQQQHTKDGRTEGQQSQGDFHKLLKICRFLFQRILVEATHVTKDGAIKIERNNGWVNAYNRAIACMLRCNQDIKFTGSSCHISALIHYTTNYATKCSSPFGEYMIALAVTKAAFEAAQTELSAASLESAAPEATISNWFSLDKFVLKAYNRFTGTLEVGGPEVARYLLGHPAHYTSASGPCRNVNTRWIRYYVVQKAKEAQRTISNTAEGDQEEADQFIGFRPQQPGTNIYQNYNLKGSILRNMCLYDYCSQIKIEPMRIEKRVPERMPFYEFNETHSQHKTHIQKSIEKREHLFDVCIQGGFGTTEQVNPSPEVRTERSEREMCLVLLGLFVPWDNLQSEFESISDNYDQTYPLEDAAEGVWARVYPQLPTYLRFHASNVRFLQKSKEAADEDRRLRNIEITEHEERAMYDVQETDLGPEDTRDEPDEIEIFGSQPRDKLILTSTAWNMVMDWQARGKSSADNDAQHLRWGVDEGSLPNCPVAVPAEQLKGWKSDMKKFKNACEEPVSISPLPHHVGSEVAYLTPELSKSLLDSKAIENLRRAFDDSPTIDNLIELIKRIMELNYKQDITVWNVLDHMLRFTDLTNSAREQLLLYIAGIGGTGKTHLIKAFLLGMNIINRGHEIILAASTGSAASNIGGCTYHSALGLGIGNNVPPTTDESRRRVRGCRVLIIDEVSLVSKKELLRIEKKCRGLWSVRPDNDSVIGSLPLVILLGDFHQFPPVGGIALWKTPRNNNEIDEAKTLWNKFNRVIILTDQMRQADDIEYQGMLTRARGSCITQADVDQLNEQTIEKRLARGDKMPDIQIIKHNATRQEINREQLEAFAKRTQQRIYMFPAKMDTTKETGLIRTEITQYMLSTGETTGWKGPGFFLYCKGMPAVLLTNQNTAAGLVNGTPGTIEEIIINEDEPQQRKHPWHKTLSASNITSHLAQLERHLYCVYSTNKLCYL